MSRKFQGCGVLIRTPEQLGKHCSMWVTATDTLSSCSVRQAVKGHAWQEVLWLAPRHAPHPPLPGPFVFQTHTHTHHLLCNSQAACRSSTQPPLSLFFPLFIPLTLTRCLLFGGRKPGYSELLFVLPPPTHTHTHKHTDTHSISLHLIQMQSFYSTHKRTAVWFWRVLQFI